MIQLSNGHAFEFMAASGALGFDGKGWPWEQPVRWLGLLKPELFTIVMKSLTLHPRKGNLKLWNPFHCVRLLKEGVVNAVGLTNPGVDAWLKNKYPAIEKSPWSFIVSIHGEKLEDYLELAKRLSACSKIKGIEINVSCPNTDNDLRHHTQEVIDTVAAISYSCRFPLILKLSATHDYITIAQETAKYIEAISINSVPWGGIYPGKRSPLAKLGGGGVSGKIAQSWTWKMAKEISQAVNVPVIGAGVWDYEDVEKLFRLGCKGIAFGSVFIRYPWRPTLFVERWRHSKK